MDRNFDGIVSASELFDGTRYRERPRTSTSPRSNNALRGSSMPWIATAMARSM